MGEVFGRQVARTNRRRTLRAGRFPKAGIVRRRKRRGSAIANFRRRLNPPADIPALGRIVFRDGSVQILP